MVNNLQFKKIKFFSQEYRYAKTLLQEAFPENERIPMWYLALNSHSRNVDFSVAYDEGVPCGLFYVISFRNIDFLLYLAVGKVERSRGYGSQILSWIKERAKGRIIVINIERADASVENYNQRIRRSVFYKRNGFYGTDYILRVKQEDYDVMASSTSFDIEELRMLVKTLHLGLIEERQR